MKIKRFLIALSLLSLLFCSAVFTACKGKFDDVNMVITCAQQISGADFSAEFETRENNPSLTTDGYLKLYMGATEKGELKHISFADRVANEFCSEAYFNISILDVPSKFSQGFSYINSNSSAVSVVIADKNDKFVKSNGGEHTIKISAISGGDAQITFYPNAGGKNKAYTLLVSVICPLESQILNTGYNPYVVAGKYENGTMVGGESLVISESKAFTFVPSVTTQKQMVYTFDGGLVEYKDINGNLCAQIKGNELFVYENYTDEYITIEAENVSSTNIGKFRIPVKVIHKVEQTDIQIFVNGKKSENNIILANNIILEMQKLVLVKFNKMPVNAEIKFLSSNESVFLVEQTTITQDEYNFTFDISSNNVGEANLIIKISYLDINYSYEIIQKVKVANFVDKIDAIGDFTNNELYLYSNAVATKAGGEKVTVVTTPTRALDNRFLIYIPLEDLQYLSITQGSIGAKIVTDINKLSYSEIDESYLYNTNSDFRIKATKSTDKNIKIYFISYHSLNYGSYNFKELETTVSTSITVNIEKGVDEQDSINFYTPNKYDKGDKSYYLVEQGRETTFTLAYPKEKFSEYITVEFLNNNVVSVENNKIILQGKTTIINNNKHSTFKVAGLNQGTTPMVITFANGYSITINIRCFIELDGLYLKTNKTSNNSSVVGRIEYDANVPEKITKLYIANNGQTVDVLLSLFYTENGAKVFSNILYDKVEFETFKDGVLNDKIIEITTTGTIKAKEVGNATVVVTLYYYTSYGIRSITAQMEVEVYKPITSIKITNSKAEVVNQITLYNAHNYYYYKNYAQETITINVNSSDYVGETSYNIFLKNDLSVDNLGNNSFIIKVKETSNIDGVNTNVIFTITQLDKTFVTSITVNIKKVTNIGSLKGVGQIYKQTYSVNEQANIEDFMLEKITFNSNATFKKLLYVFIPLNAADKNVVDFDILNAGDGDLSNDDYSGKFTTTKAVNGYIYGISKDLFKKNTRPGSEESNWSNTEARINALLNADTISEFETALKVVLGIAGSSTNLKYTENVRFLKATLEVADGSTEHPYLIRNYTELKNMDLSKHYVLRNDIDLFTYNWQPLGLEENKKLTGSLNGLYSRFGVEEKYTITGLNLIYNQAESQVGKNHYLGLFAQIDTMGSVKNLSLIVNKFNINLKVTATNNILYAGAICGVNDGAIINVNVSIINSSVNVENIEAYVGGVSGFNRGSAVKLINTSGVLNINSVYNTAYNTYIGGLFGKNETNLDLEFRLFGNNNLKIFEDDFNSSLKIYVCLDKNHNKDVYIGGAIGYSNNQIDGILTNTNIIVEKVEATDIFVNSYIGGVIGYAKDLVNNCFASGHIMAQKMSNIGGVIGLSTSTISNCTLFMFDERGENLKPAIDGGNIVGGIVGKIEVATAPVTNANFKANYIRSYYTGSDDTYFDIIGTNNVGGLIGTAKNAKIERSYAYVNKVKLNANSTETDKNIGALIGAAQENVSLSYVFFKGKLFDSNGEIQLVELDAVNKIESYLERLVGTGSVSLTEQTWYIVGDDLITSNKDSTKWKVETGYNDGDYITLLDDKTTIMSIEPPTGITAEILGVNDPDNDGNEDNNTFTENTTASNKTYFKVIDNSGKHYALLYYYKNNSRQNTIKLSDIVQIEISPTTAANQTQFLEYKTSNPNVVQIKGSYISLVGSGSVQITVTSKLNRSISSTINLVVIDALTIFEVHTTQNLQNMIVQDSITNILLDSFQQLYINCDSEQVLYKVTSENAYISLYNGILKNNSFIEYTQLDKILLEFISATASTQVSITPIYYVGGVLVELEAAFNFKYNIFKGLLEASLDSEQSDIYLDEYAQITVNTKVHEGVDSEDISAEITKATQDGNNDAIVLAAVQDVLQIDVDNKDITLSIDYEQYEQLILAEKLLKKDVSITIAVTISTTHNGVTVDETLLYNLILHNQKLYNISSKYYGYNQLEYDLYGNTTVNINEIETDKIIAGEWGLLDIELFPEFADISEIEFSYTANVQEKLSVKQVVLHKETNRYYNFGSTGVLGDDSYLSLEQGQILKINKASLINFGAPNYTTEYNGHIYLSILVKSNALTTAEFNLKIRAKDSNNNYTEYVKTLGTTVSTNISISFNGDKNYGILAHQNSLTDTLVNRKNKQDDQILLVNVQDIELNSDLSNLYFIINGSVINCSGGNTWQFNGVTSNEEEYSVVLEVVTKVVIGRSTQLSVKINSTLPINERITISYKAQTILNEKIVYVPSNQIVFTTALYSVKGYTIDGMENGVYSKAIHSSYLFKVILDARYSTSNSIDAQRAINLLELDIVEINNNRSNYFYGVHTTAARPENLDVSLNYNSYAVSADGDLYYEEYRTLLLLTPKRIYSGDNIIFSISIDYDEDIALSAHEYNRSSVIYEEAGKIKQCFNQTIPLDFFFNATEETHAQPIATMEELKNMKENGFYRLTQDIVITEKWNPLDINFKYLDGNGYSIILANGINIISSPTDEGSSEGAEEESEGNYGLFAKIYEQSVVLNLTVSLTSSKKFEIKEGIYVESTSGKEYFNPDSADYIYSKTTQFDSDEGDAYKTEENVITYNFTSSLATSLNIGLIAGKNEGSIYNCFATIGTPTILRVNLNNSLDTQKVQIGGVVGANSGFITYTKANTSIFVEEASCTIGGLVGSNSGLISTSMFEGDDKIIKSINYITTAESTDYAATGALVGINTQNGKIYESLTRNATIFSSVKASAFVCINEGLIENSYALSEVLANLISTGFVCSNSGTIKSSYSASELPKNDSTTFPLLKENTGTISDVYFIKTKEGQFVNDNGYGEILSKFSGGYLNLTKDLFKEFVFATDNDSRDGYWHLDTNNYPTLAEENYIANLKTNKTGSCFASWELIDSEINENVETYNWKKTEGAGVDGDTNNPVVIYSESNFNAAFTNKTITNYNYVVVNDIEFTSSELSSTSRNLNKNLFNANHMTFKKLKLNAAAKKVDYFGLFATINESLIKNFVIDIQDVYANTAKVVGALAGKISNSQVININISSENENVVQGINLVGGLAGIVESSTIYNINVNVCVNASYTGGEQFLYNLPLNSDNKVDLSNLKSSYAGAICGVVLGEPSHNTTITNVSVGENSIVLGYAAATGFGYVGENVIINYARIQIAPEQFIFPKFVGGGLVAQNHGCIKNSFIEYSNPEYMLELDTFWPEENAKPSDDDYELTFRTLNYFRNDPLVIGGLVGINFSATGETLKNGLIQNCYSKIDVRNTNTVVAGGLVGITVQGKINNCYATGSVYGKNVTGGLIGSVTTLQVVVATVRDKVEQAGSGIYPASDLYEKHEAGGYNKDKINDNSNFKDYVVKEDGSIGTKDYAVTIQNNLALNNYKFITNKSRYDYQLTQFFGASIGTVYGTLSGGVSTVNLTNIKNNFNYNLESENGKPEDNIGSVSDMLNGDEVINNSMNNAFGNNLRNIYKIYTYTDGSYKDYSVYAIVDDNGQPVCYYVGPEKETDNEEELKVQYFYINNTTYKVEEVGGNYELEEAPGHFSVALTPSGNDGQGDTLNVSSTPGLVVSNVTISTVKNGKFQEIAKVGDGQFALTDEAQMAYSAHMQEKMQEEFDGKATSTIYYDSNRYLIYESSYIKIVVTKDGTGLKTVEFTIPSNAATATYTYTFGSKIWSGANGSENYITYQIISALNQTLGWQKYTSFTREEMENDAELKDFENKALLQIYLDCNFSKNGKYEINKDLLQPILEKNIENYKLLALNTQDGYEELELSKEKLIAPTIDKRINTAKLFELVFENGYNFDVDGINTIFPSIEINLNVMNGYTLLEYIKSDGSQYIDTGVVATENTGFEVTFATYDKIATGSGYGSIFGARIVSNDNELQLTTYTNDTENKKGILRWNNSSNNAGITVSEEPNTNKLTASLRNGKFINCEGNEQSFIGTFNSVKNITIFAVNDSVQGVVQKGSLKLYSFKLYNGDTLIRHFIPCYRNSDNKVGLYDIVNNEFYISPVGDAFENGPIV